MGRNGIMVGGDPAAPHPSAPALVRGQLHDRPGRCRSRECRSRGEVGQLPLGARLQVDEPEILMLNLSSQEHECPSSGQEGQVSSPPSQGQGRQGMRCGLGRDGFHRKRGADVGSRVDNEAAVGRPRGIDRVLLDKRSAGGPTVDRHAEEVWDAVIVRRRGDRLAVGRPCGSALQVERIGHDPRVRAVGLHHVQERLPVLPDRECDVPSIGGDCRAAKDLRSLATPQLRARSVGELPDTLARAGRRNIQKIIWTQSWGEPRAGRQRDSSSRRYSAAGESAIASARVFSSDLRAWQPDGDRQRWPPATCTGQGQRSAGGECGARRPCCKATVPNHRDRWRGTSACADPTGPDDSRAHCAT